MHSELIVQNGVPAWRQGDGTVLPVMAGGDDEGALAALAALLQGGQGENLLQLAGAEFIHIGSGRSGVLSYREASATERRQGHDIDGKVFFLQGPSGTQFLSGRGGYSLMDSLRNVTIVGQGGTTSSGGKASETDLDRMFGAGAATDGTGSTGYASPQWRPGELELAQQELAQRLEEIQMGIDADIAAAEAAHTNAMAILDKELEHASGLQRERIKAERELEELRHANNIKALTLRLDAERKNILYGEIGATGRTMMEQQGAMGRQLLQLGPDPSTMAAGLAGMVTRGVTPQQQAVGQAKAFINQPIPQASMNMSTPQLQGMLTGMQGIRPPMASGQGMAGQIGMAKGGVIEMKKGADGKFSKQTVLVGEAGPEVLTVDKGRVEVTPLTGTAQFGARIGGVGAMAANGSDWWQAPRGISSVPERVGPMPQPVMPLRTTPTAQSLLQGLAPLFAGSVFGNVPRAAGYGMGYPTPLDDWRIRPPDPTAPITLNPVGGMSPMEMLSELGIAPQLIRTGTAAGERHTYYIEGGKRYYIPGGGNPDTLIELGLNPAQVVQVSPAAINQFQPGGTFTGTGAQAPGAVPLYDPGSIGALGAPLIDPVSGALLPHPKDRAAIWRDLLPVQQQAALSAYGAAGGPASSTGFGLDPTAVEHIIQTFTPAGRGYGRRIGGLGTQY